MNRIFWLETFGCQMNVLDSELITSSLLAAGWTRAAARDEADVVLLNTCSVREHAEEKVYSALGRLKAWKEMSKELGRSRVLGVLGCMAQREQATIFRRAPHVDLVLGPGQLDMLIELLGRGGGKQLEKRLEISPSLHASAFRPFDPPRLLAARPSQESAYVRIVLGCNQRCAYCVVPNTRGPEQSRPAADILREVQTLVDQGCSDITFLGQTVNSYAASEPGGSTTRLADLLCRASDISGIEHIHFLTNYPRGMDDDLLDAVTTLPKVEPFFHVPAQSGSDAVLSRMQRKYTVGEYRDMVLRIRERMPCAAIVSDFIVGFCGETDAEFYATLDLIRWANFAHCYLFKYSQRSGTPAALLPDNVPEATKRARHAALLALITSGVDSD